MPPKPIKRKLIENNTIRTVKDLGACLEPYTKTDTPVWFRGQSDFSWGLEPSLSRPPFRLDHELTLIKRFRQDAFSLVEKLPSSEWDWLFLMQHYGMPTRLLDWSQSPLVALYFAVESTQHANSDAALWLLRPLRLNEIAGLPKAPLNDLPSFGDDQMLEDYLPSKIGMGNKICHPVAALAQRKFSRIIAQHGTFIIFEKDFSKLNNIKDESCLVKFRIPASSKQSILKELRIFQIHKNAIYPELSNLSAIIKEEFKK